MIQTNRYIGGWGGWRHGRNKILGTPIIPDDWVLHSQAYRQIFCHPNMKPC